MGVSDLNLVNIALILRWWWKAYRDPDGLWSVTVCKIRMRRQINLGPKIWLRTGSFFWAQQRKIRHLLDWSTIWEIGSGTSISYWYDAWHGKPRAVTYVTASQRPRISLADAWQDIGQTNPDEHLLTAPILLPNATDLLVWRWTATGTYSAASVYKAMAEGGMVRSQFGMLWTAKAPPTMRIFTYLMLHGKILTRDVLSKRGLNLQLQCEMCQACLIESILHLLYLCPYKVGVWFEVSQSLGCSIMKPALTVQGIWDASWGAVATTGTITKMEWTVLFICISWMIWKQRNTLIFREERRLPAKILAVRCLLEARMWMQFC